MGGGASGDGAARAQSFIVSASKPGWLATALGWLRRGAEAGDHALDALRWRPFRLPQSPNEAFIEANREAAEEAFHAAGAGKAVAALVMQAGYTGPDAFRAAAWTAGEAGGRYESAEWRISIQHGCTPATLEEVRVFHERLVETARRKRYGR